jgi:hypothetical protein
MFNQSADFYDEMLIDNIFNAKRSVRLISQVLFTQN